MSQYDDKPTPIYTMQVKSMPDSPWQIVERSYLTRSVALKNAQSYRDSFPDQHAVRLVAAIIDESLTEILSVQRASNVLKIEPAESN